MKLFLWQKGAKKVKKVKKVKRGAPYGNDNAVKASRQQKRIKVGFYSDDIEVLNKLAKKNKKIGFSLSNFIRESSVKRAKSILSKGKA